MSQVLYRKYRAQDFDHLVGQTHIVPILKNAVKTGNLSHAYLFTGSRGTGKTSTARIFAKAVNCLNRKEDGNPCNECTVCTAVTKGHFLDLIEIDAASNRGIDQIRELKEKIEFSPVEGKYKIYIIDEVHMLTTEAFNALLKTLEEPPSHVIFILATTDVHKLPPTILSRCQRYDFRLGSDEEITHILEDISTQENLKISKDGIRILVDNAKGSYRDALSLLDVVVSGQLDSKDPKEVSESEIREILGIPDSTMVYYLLEKVVYNDKVAALEMVREIDKKGINLQQFVKYCLIMLRDILIQKMKESLNPKEYSFAVDLSLQQILSLINYFLVADRNLRNSPIPALELEMIIGSVDFTNPAPVQVVKPAPKKPEVKKPVKEPEEKKEDKVVERKINLKEEKKVVEESVNTIEFAKDLDVSVIKQNWKLLTKKIQPANGHLFAFLERVNILGFENDKLQLEVPFQFHKDRIEDPKSREAIYLVCKEVYGKQFAFECIVNDNIKNKKKVEPDFILNKISESIKPQEVKVEKQADGGKEAFKQKVSKDIEAIFEDM